VSINLHAADVAVQVQLDFKKANPRTVEELTERANPAGLSILVDEPRPGTRIQTLSDPLEGPFAGDAKRWLKQSVVSQQRVGLNQKYMDQTHYVEAVFYAPEEM